MRNLYKVLCVLYLCLANPISAQDVGQERFVATPREILLPVVVQQPDSPLQLTRVREVTSLEGRFRADFLVRNQGTKPIRSYTVAAWNSEATGNVWGFNARDQSEWIMPGQTTPYPHSSEGEIIPLTDALRDRLRLRGPMRGFRIYMVVRVELADGTIYSDEAAFNALQEYLERLNSN